MSPGCLMMGPMTALDIHSINQNQWNPNDPMGISGISKSLRYNMPDIAIGSRLISQWLCLNSTVALLVGFQMCHVTISKPWKP